MLRTGANKVLNMRTCSLAQVRFANDGTTTDFKEDYGLRDVPPGGKHGKILPQPIAEEIRKRERTVSANWIKQSTGLTGLFVNENPHHSLSIIYGRIMRILQLMPADYKYRVHTEGIINHRMKIVQEETDPVKIEERVGMGQVEELVVQAEHELECARLLLQHKAWEPLVGEPPIGQWNWPI